MHVNPEAIRLELIRMRDEIFDLKKPERSRNVCLIEIKWFRTLSGFLMKPNIEMPGPISNSPLLNGKTLRTDIKYKFDYAIVEENAYSFLESVFRGGPRITRKYTINPRDMSPCVLLESVVLKIQTERKGRISKTVSPTWRFIDLKPHVCKFLNINEKFFVFSNRIREKINENSAIGDYVKMNGDTVRLTKHNRAAHSSLLSTLPQTFPQSCVCNVVEETSKLLSSTLPQHKLYPFPNGLVNLGNTCFLNSAVQCIARLKPLYEYVLSPEYDLAISRKSSSASNDMIAVQFKNLLDEMTKSDSFINPRSLRNAVVSKYSSFADFAEHDAQEALCAILDTLHENLKEDGESFISKTFYGKTKSIIKCPLCGDEQVKEETFLTLTLPCAGNDLMDCINSFITEEVLDENNKWTCDKCNEDVMATRKTVITELPRILIIQLNRFDSWRRKDNRFIQYPASLDLTEQVPNSLPMHLVAAIFHRGGINDGHYTASVYNEEEKRWYNFNDSETTKIRPSDIISQNAYILFYEA